MTVPATRTLALITICTATTAAAQTCIPQIQPLDPTVFGIASINSEFFSDSRRVLTTWDPDGPGPLTNRLVLAGNFTVAGNTLARRIAAYDPATQTFFPLGPGLEYQPSAATALPDGRLVVSQPFPSASGLMLQVWDGSTWAPFATPLQPQPNTCCDGTQVRALATLPDGSLIAAGSFLAGPAANLARWNGSTWAPLGTGITGQDFVVVTNLAVMPNGDLVATGSFNNAGGVVVEGSARWNGSTWASFDPVRNITTLPSGDRVATRKNPMVAGFIGTSVVKWNGTDWIPVGTPFFGVTTFADPISSIAMLPSGDLVVSGAFAFPSRNVARWDGTAWVTMGSAFSGSVFELFPTVVRALAPLPSGDLVAGGNFITADGRTANSLARWNGTTWTPMGTGISGSAVGSPPAVHALAILPSGDLVAAGQFNTVGGLRTNAIARWDGSRWLAFASGLPGPVNALTVLPNGDLVASSGVSRWNGSTWLALGTGLNGPVNALAVLPNTDLVAAGNVVTSDGAYCNIARRNGAVWSPLGQGVFGTFDTAYALARLPTGDLIAGGGFTNAGGIPVNCIARWNGSTWAPLGTGITTFGDPAPPSYRPYVKSLAVLPNGELIVGGLFGRAGGDPAACIAKWSPSTGLWSSLGIGMNDVVNAIVATASGDVVAAGDFSAVDGIPTNFIARWNGSTWAPLGPGLNAPVLALAALPNGDIIAGGYFTASGTVVTPSLARYTSTPACYANCDCSTDGLASPDFACFLTNYRNAAPYADCNNSGTLSPADFTCFLARYRQGCP